ncbi:28009_t:CDS:2 [Gigaspora margarita]|uniref:28009_t:CDS:1 n=1 Tax=Gigaspora margarita TaxID=4874 RepID=A0ABN7UWY5_GIGMA|nr:28009_t:CDS:2 [Gigaspora margarita]
MDILKQAQTIPIFSVYPDKTSKKFTHHNFFKEPMTISDAINLQEITSSNEVDKNQVTNSTDTNDKESSFLWPNAVIKSLLSYLSDNMSLYRMNKQQFYFKVLYILVMVKWEIRFIIRSGHLSTGVWKKAQTKPAKIYRNNSQKDNGNDKDKSLKSNKKRRLDEDEMHYIKSIDMITQSKKIEVETKQKLLELEKEKLQFEKEKWEHEKNEKIILEKYKLELEYKLQLDLKTRELELKIKNEAVTENEL